MLLSCIYQVVLTTGKNSHVVSPSQLSREARTRDTQNRPQAPCGYTCGCFLHLYFSYCSTQGRDLPGAKCFIKTFSEFVFRKCCLNWLATAFLAGRLLFGQGFTDDQLVLVEQNTLMVEEREREIRQIVQSISDLSEIFRDLGAMIVEQVCVLWGVLPFLPRSPFTLYSTWENI